MKGIDISTWQQNINYIQVKASGIEFAIIRCGYGKNESQKDKMFETHYAGCKYAGLRVGAYLYSYATSVENARKEAENCLKFIKEKEFDLPIFYDLEDKIIRPLGKETITKMAQVFCETIENAGYKAGIYANLDWFTNYIDIDKVKQYKIWLAQWSNEHTTKFDIDYWQYTSKGKVSGINGNVDMNICYDIKNDAYVDTDSVVENGENHVENKGQYKTYVVKYGDTLSAIAEKFGTTYQKIAKDNNIQNPDVIYANQKLKIYTNETEKKETIYVVKYGDTLSEIAEKFGTTYQKIAKDNNIQNPDVIYANQKLVIK